MPSKLLRTIATACAALPLPAAAQTNADYAANELSRKDAEYLRTVRPFADCLVARGAKEIPKFLGDPDMSRGIGRNLAKSHPECPRPRSSNNDTTSSLQGAILEAMIRRDFGNVTAPANFEQL